jgi:hypothetical protein
MHQTSVMLSARLSSAKIAADRLADRQDHPIVDTRQRSVDTHQFTHQIIIYRLSSAPLYIVGAHGAYAQRFMSSVAEKYTADEDQLTESSVHCPSNQCSLFV